MRHKKLIGIEVLEKGPGHSEAEVAQRHLRTAVTQGSLFGDSTGPGRLPIGQCLCRSQNGGEAANQDCPDRVKVAET